MIERYAIAREVAMTEKVEIITTPAKLVPIDSLVPHPNNPRQGDVGAIVQSIKANGFYGAIVAQAGTNVIIVGEHRWLAAKEAGMTKVPVAFADVDDAAARKIMLADNRTSDLAEYDQELLVELLKVEAADAGLEGTGYDGDDLDAMIAGLEPLPAEEKNERQETFYRCPKCGYSWTGKPTGGETVE
jgi:ParB-like chromosome segregation protein Spo0J